MVNLSRAGTRLLTALLALAAALSAASMREEIAIAVAIGSIVVMRVVLHRERYDRTGAGALALMVPTVPWVGSELLLVVGLAFFALRRSSHLVPPDLKNRQRWRFCEGFVMSRRASAEVCDKSRPAAESSPYLWLAPFAAYLLGSVIAEVGSALGVLGSPRASVLGPVRVDSIARTVDLLRALVDVHVYTWRMLARVVLAGWSIAFLSERTELIVTFIRWLKRGCVLSAGFVLVQWMLAQPFVAVWWWPVSLALPNQTPIWDALGRPSGLLTDPNALGVVMALALWMAALVPTRDDVGQLRGYLWVVLIAAAGVVSGSRTFLLSAGLLGLAVLWRLGGRTRALGGVCCLVALVGLVTVADGYSGLVAHLVTSEAVPMGLRRGVAALSLLRIEETVMSRSVFLEFAREIGSGHWLFGVGADRFIDYVPLVGAERNLVRGWRDNSNNFYLGMLVELGILGAVAFTCVVVGRRLRYHPLVKAERPGRSFLAVLMLGAIGCTGPHTDFTEVLVLVAVLVALTTEPRDWFVCGYRYLAALSVVAGAVAATFHERGVYGWSDTNTGAARWLSHSASVELLCNQKSAALRQARLVLKPRYIPQTEPLKVIVATTGQERQEVLFQTAEARQVSVPCSVNDERVFVRVTTTPTWSPYRAWPRVSEDRRILGVEQVTISR